MKKHEKILLIIFLLFFIYFITIKIFSLKFREGATKCSYLYNTKKKCKYYKDNKSLCSQTIKNECKKKYCKFNFYGAVKDINACEYSQCLRPYSSAIKGCVGEGGGKGQENIYNEKINPCMNTDFCKNCKKCFDDNKNKDKIPLDDGTLFDCKKCLHNGRKENPSRIDDGNKESTWCSIIGWGC